MDDLISRQTIAVTGSGKMAKKYIEAKEFWNRLISVSENDWVGFDTIDEILSEMPAADVVEVVRCKDCKHYQFADNRAFGMPVKMCEWFGFEDVDDDDFAVGQKGELMDDLISRQAAINSQIKMIAQGLDWVPVYHLEQLPSAERRGRWIDLKCDQCGQVDISKPNYCPNCGARMEATE